MPSLREAYQYFRTYTNPRRARDYEAERALCAARQNFRKIWRKAGAHEQESELFPAFNLNTNDLGLFGIGIALYFKQLKWLSISFLACGCICSYSIWNYATSFDIDASISDYGDLLPGSAICHDYKKVIATSDCPHNAATCESVISDNCDLKLSSGITVFVSIALLFIYSVLMIVVGEREHKILDESMQTPKDYAVVVNDPGPDDDDPDEWHSYFSQFGEVAYISIGRANSKLLNAISERRYIQANLALYSSKEHPDVERVANTTNNSSVMAIELGDIEESSEKTTLLSGENSFRTEEMTGVKKFFWEIARKLGLVRSKEDWEISLEKVNFLVSSLSKREYSVTRVYCVFNSEKGKRNCLKRLRTGRIQAALELKDRIKPSLIFKNTNVLHVSNPSEPSEILWQHLELDWKFCFVQSLVSMFVTCCMIAGAYFFIHQIDEDSSRLIWVVTAINYILPTICWYLTYAERHYLQSDAQNSLMVKLVMTRFMNTALIAYFSSHKMDTLTYSQMATIQALFISDAFVTPTLAACDIYYNFSRLVLSRLSVTQKQMNSYFLGSAWDLAERYTSMLKTVLVAMFYVSLYPAGLFFASFCFMYTYIVDRFMLTRQWRSVPAYDAKLARKAHVIILLCILVHLIVTCSWYAEWPFDTAVRNSDGTFKYLDKIHQTSTFFDNLSPATLSWASHDQQLLTTIYSWSSLLLFSMATAVCSILYGYRLVLHLFLGSSDVIGDDQHIPFRSVTRIPAYVPTCSRNYDLVGELIACHSISLNVQNYPYMLVHDDENLEDAFTRLNVALEFPEQIRSRLFGIVQGYRF